MTPDSELRKFHSDQALLFPDSGLQLSDQIGLNRWAAAKLHEDGWLSFPPETTAELSENQVCELRFVGALVTGGCSPALLPELLECLEKPYCYDNRQIYYDWEAKSWKLIPNPYAEIQTLIEEWIDQLRGAKEVEQLEEIKAQVNNALRELEVED